MTNHSFRSVSSWANFEELRSLKKKLEENTSASTMTTTTITDVRQAMADSQRPSVIAFCVKEETCRSLCF